MGRIEATVNSESNGRNRPTAPTPRGLSRVQSAAYVGVSPTLFDRMVKDKWMPPPKRVYSRTIWDRNRLDEAFDALPGEDYTNPWDDRAA
jgi:hypothetical protein